MPLNEILVDFNDKLKSITRGYGSMDYEYGDYQAEKLVKMVRELQPGIRINNRAGLPCDFDTPEHIKEGCIAALKAGKTKYAPTPGIEPLRRAGRAHCPCLRHPAVGRSVRSVRNL